ncbi:hypothetical protein SAMN05892877_12728 [Rhizobium subbaraonis]|uniref:Uncharacterized protein n=1 Tax=Rhizobium subbaraonis TaxID=908946 RepID=A0A285V0K1_9HYPH|nr:hypothetical protein SAMN05892877_12728 [Rhizobium subbaraonis]
MMRLAVVLGVKNAKPPLLVAQRADGACWKNSGADQLALIASRDKLVNCNLYLFLWSILPHHAEAGGEYRAQLCTNQLPRFKIVAIRCRQDPGDYLVTANWRATIWMQRMVFAATLWTMFVQGISTPKKFGASPHFKTARTQCGLPLDYGNCFAQRLGKVLSIEGNAELLDHFILRIKTE